MHIRKHQGGTIMKQILQGKCFGFLLIGLLFASFVVAPNSMAIVVGCAGFTASAASSTSLTFNDSTPPGKEGLAILLLHYIH